MWNTWMKGDKSTASNRKFGRENHRMSRVTPPRTIPKKPVPSYVSRNINYNSGKKKHPNAIGDRQVPERRGGRPKGVPNIVTSTVRSIFADFVEHNVAGAQELYDKVAKRNPAKALDILAKVAEFVVPKLNRTEVNIPGSGPLITPGPIRDANEAANVYIAIMGNPIIDIHMLTFQPPPVPEPVAVQDRVAHDNPDPPPADNVVSIRERLGK